MFPDDIYGLYYRGNLAIEKANGKFECNFPILEIAFKEESSLVPFTLPEIQK